MPGTRAQHGEPARGEPTVVPAVLPDLIDNGLWLGGSISIGRTAAHLLFGTAVLVGIAGILPHKIGRPDLSVAVAIR